MVLPEAEIENRQVDGGAHVVNVGHKDELPALVDELREEAGVVERLVKVSVARRIPPMYRVIETYAEKQFLLYQV